MPNLASWILRRDEALFQPLFSAEPTVKIWNAAREEVPLDQMDALLLTGGTDVGPEFLRQPVPDPSVLEKSDPERDQWEFAAVASALERGLAILAICRGMQVLNVALGGTLRLDIPGHNLPEQKTRDVQPLRHDASARHRFDRVNSSHHQALDRLGDGLVAEAWSKEDDVVEQVRLTGRGFVVGVQYHPERGTIYGAIFDDFLGRLS